MGKTRNVFIILVLNIFLTLLVSVMMEYATLSERFLNLERNINSALAAALDASTMSEEMFSDEYNAKVFSYASVDSGGTNYRVSSRMLAYDWDYDTWFHVNPYIYSMYVSTNGSYPNSVEYNTYEVSNGTTANVYKWLYGGIGSDYTASQLDWASTNYETDLQYSSMSLGNRLPSSDFGSFYKAIGCKMKSYSYVKKKDGNGFNIVLLRHNTLDNMGLDFTGSGGGTNYSVSSDPCYTSKTSSYSSDNFISSTHVGKYANGVYSNYYLTPNSLGVTYVPQPVLESSFKSCLETIVRMQVMSAGGNASQATGCVSMNMYDTGGTQQAHTSSGMIVNDGQVEYDLSTIESQIDYFLVDFHSLANADVVGGIIGGIPSCNVTSTEIEAVRSEADANIAAVDRLSNNNTNRFYKYPTNFAGLVENSPTNGVVTSDFGQRIVARVTLRIKIHVPYQSGILQWAYEYGRTDADTNTGGLRNSASMTGVSEVHYDVPSIDVATGDIIFNDSGIWYQTVQYFTISQ